MRFRHMAMAVLTAALTVGSGASWLHAQADAGGAKGDNKSGNTPAPAAQDGGNRGGGNRGGGGGGGGGGGDWRERMNERMKEGLGAPPEEEWKVFQTKIEKIRALQMQAMGGFGRGRGGPGGGGQGGGPGGQGAEAPPTEVGKASQDLRTALEDKSSSEDTIKAKLEALRKARAKAREEMTAAQKDLREISSVKQEAFLVSMNILE